DLLQQLEGMEKDPKVQTVLLRIEEFPLGLAAAEETARAINRLVKAGKSVEVYLGSAGLKEYLIASPAQKIFLEPAGELRWLGVRSERYFLRGSLDKLGIQPEFLAAGKYKSAPEMFMRKDLSEPARTATLDQLRATELALRTTLQHTREITEEKWKQISKLGVLSASEAQNLGLIEGQASFTSEIARRETREWIQAWSAPRRTSLHLPPRISVVVAQGNILPSSNRWLRLAGSDGVTPLEMEKKLLIAKKDPRTEAIILRISSPGGEVLASQQIAQRVADTAKDKALFVSMGDVAASGGYYIAAPGKRIFANPMTLTGSIGVFLGKFDFGGLYRWIGLNKEILSDAPYPGLYSEHRAWSDAEKAVMQRRLGSYYEDFLAHVSKFRSLDEKKTRSVAEGRVWTGGQANGNGLVDDLGGYYETVQAVASAQGLSSEEYEIEEIELPIGLMDEFTPTLFANISEPTWSLLAPRQPRPALERLSLFRDHPFQYLTPISAPE
ncbi:signal peptide peptidase SppA, partial [bacterium]|nr:signal peptide peptidase SppA [bacterium]